MTRFRSIDQAATAGTHALWAHVLLSAAVMVVAGACGLATTAAAATPAQAWHTDWQSAVAEAEATQRPILAVFTGTDWCPHCQLLEQHVLGTPQFEQWSQGRVVLLMVDLPKRTIPQKVRDERSALCRRYGVSSFPNVVLIGPDGGKLASQPGYNRQTPEVWIAAVDRHLQPRPETTPLAAREASPKEPTTGAALDEAVRQAEGSKRPLLVVVSRSSDQQGRIRAASLVSDPAFREFTDDHFVVTQVSADDGAHNDAAAAKPPLAEPIGSLLGGVPLPSDEVEVIVTYDGKTPMYSQSARQPTPRLISALRRFLGVRAATMRR